MLRRNFLQQSALGVGALIASRGLTSLLKGAALDSVWREFVELLQATELSGMPEDLAKWQQQAGDREQVLPFDLQQAKWYSYHSAGEVYVAGWLPLVLPDLQVIGFLTPIYTSKGQGNWAPVATLSCYQVEAVVGMVRQGHPPAQLVPVCAGRPTSADGGGYTTPLGRLTLVTRLASHGLTTEAYKPGGSGKSGAAASITSGLT